MKAIQVTDEVFAALERIGKVLEVEPETLAGYLLSVLEGDFAQYTDAVEIGELIGVFEYEPEVEKRVRQRVAAMIREEQHFANPALNERHAQKVETGAELLPT